MEKTKEKITSNRTFGDNLSLYRHVAKMTPRKLSKRIGVEEPIIKRWISNAGLPNTDEFRAILAAFGNKPTDWLTGMREADKRAFMQHTGSGHAEDMGIPRSMIPGKLNLDPPKTEVHRRNLFYELTKEDKKELEGLTERYVKGEFDFHTFCEKFSANPRSMYKFLKEVYGTDNLPKQYKHKDITDDTAVKIFKDLPDSKKRDVKDLILDKFIEAM